MSLSLPLQQQFTWDDLQRAGFTRGNLRQWLEQGQVRRLAQGVYVRSDAAPTPGRRHPQVRLAVTRGDVPTPILQAAQVHRLWVPPKVPTQLLSADGRRVIPQEHVEARDGRLVPSLPWTAVQLARWQDMAGALLSLDCALRFGVPKAQLIDIAVGMRRWPGASLLRRAIAAADARAESALESYSRGLIINEGLPMPQLQYELTVDGMRMRCDFAYPEQRLVLEADGEGKFGGNAREREQAHEHFLRRQGRLQKAGFVLLRWGWPEVFPNPQGWAHSLRTALARI